jgi:hypothetical protein
MSTALHVDYIHRIHTAAKRALGSVYRRRAWVDTEWCSPMVALQLCEEIARLNVELERVAALTSAYDEKPK